MKRQQVRDEFPPGTLTIVLHRDIDHKLVRDSVERMCPNGIEMEIETRGDGSDGR